MNLQVCSLIPWIVTFNFSFLKCIQFYFRNQRKQCRLTRTLFLTRVVSPSIIIIFFPLLLLFLNLGENLFINGKVSLITNKQNNKQFVSKCFEIHSITLIQLLSLYINQLVSTELNTTSFKS